VDGEVTLIRRFKTTLEYFPMSYDSISFYIVRDTIYVLNGAEVGNAVLQFDMEGNYLGQMPGWFNFPVDLVVGGQTQDQVLLSAIGAMGDNSMLRFGLVMYDSSGNFFHGYHEADSGLKRPCGLTMDPVTNMVAVCDWAKNRTVLLNVNWKDGTVEQEKELAALPYPYDIAMTRDRMIVTTMVCCEEWHKAARAVSIYLRDADTGVPSLWTRIKSLPTGENITDPGSVAITEEEDRILFVDQGLKKTIMLDMDGEYLGEVTGGLGAPREIQFYGGLLYSLTNEGNFELNVTESFLNVFSYTWDDVTN